MAYGNDWNEETTRQFSLSISQPIPLMLNQFRELHECCRLKRTELILEDGFAAFIKNSLR